MAGLLFPILMLGLLWVLMIRPQQRRLREHQALVATLGVGDEVVTAGGIYGTVVGLDDATVELRVADGVVVRLLRSAVNGRVVEDEGFDELEEWVADDRADGSGPDDEA
jgi:preprotein translocase subunit YajC